MATLLEREAAGPMLSVGAAAQTGMWKLRWVAALGEPSRRQTGRQCPLTGGEVRDCRDDRS